MKKYILIAGVNGAGKSTEKDRRISQSFKKRKRAYTESACRFPDSTEKMLEADYVSAIKSDIFDSYGYFILKAGYTTDDYK